MKEWNKLFKGYIRLSEKKSIDKFSKGAKLKTLEEVQGGIFGGVIDENIILIDVDNEEDSNKLMDLVEAEGLKPIVAETTRGMHFYFTYTGEQRIKNNTNIPVACGLKVDIKCGRVPCYAKLINNDNTIRPIIRGFDDFGEYEPQELPKWLYPISNGLYYKDVESGSRNNTLFSYILKLQTSGFNKDEIRETLRIMNDYLLDEPLSESELNTITRDDAFKKELFYEDKKFKFNKFAEYIKSQCNIKRIEGALHIYKNGVYIHDDSEIERAMIKRIPTLKQKDRKEVLSYLNLLCDTNEVRANANLISFKNGTYSLVDEQLHNDNPNDIITNKLSIDYNPDAYDELMDKTLDKLSCNDKDIRSLLEEMVGYCFYRRNEMKKFFVLTGDGNNGKSTFLDVLIALIGEENRSSLDLNELGDRFRSVRLLNKLANIGDDIDDDYIPSSNLLKKLVSGNSVTVEHKGKDAFEFSNYSKLIFSANDVPRIGRGTDSKALQTRMVIIPFEYDFTKDDEYDPCIKDKLTSENALQYLANLGLKALKRVLQTRKFTQSDKVDEFVNEYMVENNSVLGFINEHPIKEGDSCNDIFLKYEVYCEDNRLKALTSRKFYKIIKDNLNLETTNKRIDGKVMKTFIKK